MGDSTQAPFGHARPPQFALNAAASGMRAARQAGKSPPMKPMTRARITPCQTTSGESCRLKTTWVKPDPSVEAESR